MRLGGTLRNAFRLCFTCLNALDTASGFLRVFDRTCHLTASTIRPDIYVSNEIPAVVFMESYSDSDAAKEAEGEAERKKEAERLSRMSGSQYYRSKEYIFRTSSSRMEKWGRFAVLGVGRRLLDLFESPGLEYATLVISVGLLISSIVLFPPVPAIIALCAVLFAAGVDFYISYGGYTSKRRDRNHLATLYLVDSLLAEDKTQSQEESKSATYLPANSSDSIMRQRKIMAAYTKDLRGVDLEKAKEETSENRLKVIWAFSKSVLPVMLVNCTAFALGLVLCSTPISVFGIIALTLGILSCIYIYSKYKAAFTNKYLHQQVTETVEERISQKLETLLGTEEGRDEPTLTQEQKEALAILHNLYDIAPEKAKAESKKAKDVTSHAEVEEGKVSDVEEGPSVEEKLIGSISKGSHLLDADTIEEAKDISSKRKQSGLMLLDYFLDIFSPKNLDNLNYKFFTSRFNIAREVEHKLTESSKELEDDSRGGELQCHAT